jgi:hypothetical protein
VTYPFGPDFQPAYDKAFLDDRRELGLHGSNFDFFFEQVESQILNYPWINAREVPESGGVLMRETRGLAPDLPALYIYYKVSKDPPRILFLGLSRAWSHEDEA